MFNVYSFSIPRPQVAENNEYLKITGISLLIFGLCLDLNNFSNAQSE